MRLKTWIVTFKTKDSERWSSEGDRLRRDFGVQRKAQHWVLGLLFASYIPEQLPEKVETQKCQLMSTTTTTKVIRPGTAQPSRTDRPCPAVKPTENTVAHRHPPGNIWGDQGWSSRLGDNESWRQGEKPGFYPHLAEQDSSLPSQVGWNHKSIISSYQGGWVGSPDFNPSQQRLGSTSLHSYQKQPDLLRDFNKVHKITHNQRSLTTSRTKMISKWN